MRTFVVCTLLVVLFAVVVQAEAEQRSIAPAKCRIAGDPHAWTFSGLKHNVYSQGEYSAWHHTPPGAALEKWHYATRVHPKTFRNRAVAVGVALVYGSNSVAVQYDADYNVVVYCNKVKDADLTRKKCGTIKLKIEAHKSTAGVLRYYSFKITSPSSNYAVGQARMRKTGAKYMNINIFDQAELTGSSGTGSCVTKGATQLASDDNFFGALPAKKTAAQVSTTTSTATKKKARKECHNTGSFAAACRSDVTTALNAGHPEVATEIANGYRRDLAALRAVKENTKCDAKSRYQCKSYGCKKEQVCVGTVCHTKKTCLLHKCKCVLRSVTKKAYAAGKKVTAARKHLNKLRGQLKTLNAEIKTATGSKKTKLRKKRRRLRRRIRKAKRALTTAKATARSYHHRAWKHYNNKSKSHKRASAKLTVRIKKTRKQIKALKAAIAELDTKIAATTSTSRKTALLGHREKLKKKLGHKEKLLTRLKNQRKKHNKLAAANATAATHHAGHRKKYKSNKKTPLHVSLHHKYKKAKRAHNKSKSRIAAKKAEIKTLLNKAKKTDHRINKVSKALLTATGTHKTKLNARLNKLNTRKENLKKKIKQAREDLKGLRKRHKNLGHNLSSLHSSWKKAKRRHKTRKANTKRIVYEHSLQDKIATQRAKVITLKALLTAATTKHGKKKYRRRLKKARARLHKLREHYKATLKKHKKLGVHKKGNSYALSGSYKKRRARRRKRNRKRIKSAIDKLNAAHKTVTKRKKSKFKKFLKGLEPKKKKVPLWKRELAVVKVKVHLVRLIRRRKKVNAKIKKARHSLRHAKGKKFKVRRARLRHKIKKLKKRRSLLTWKINQTRATYKKLKNQVATHKRKSKKKTTTALHVRIHHHLKKAKKARKTTARHIATHTKKLNNHIKKRKRVNKKIHATKEALKTATGAHKTKLQERLNKLKGKRTTLNNKIKHTREHIKKLKKRHTKLTHRVKALHSAHKIAKRHHRHTYRRTRTLKARKKFPKLFRLYRKCRSARKTAKTLTSHKARRTTIRKGCKRFWKVRRQTYLKLERRRRHFHYARWYSI